MFTKFFNSGFFIFHVWNALDDKLIEKNDSTDLYFPILGFLAYFQAGTMPNCNVLIQDVLMTAREYDKELPFKVASNMLTLYKKAKEAILIKKLLNVLIIEYYRDKKGLKSFKWFVGKLCGINIINSASIKGAKSFLRCFCLNKICLLSYNYISKSTLVPGAFSVDSSSVNALYDIYKKGFSVPKEALRNAIDYSTIMKGALTNITPSLNKDNVVLFTNKCIQNLFKVRETQYTNTINNVKIDIPKVNLSDYLYTDYYVSSLIFPEKEDKSTLNGQLIFENYFLLLISNSVISTNITDSLFGIFSPSIMLMIVPTGNKGLLLVIPSGFIVLNLEDTLSFTVNDISQGALLQDSIQGLIEKPECLIASYKVSYLFLKLSNRVLDLHIEAFGIFPSELRDKNQNIQAKQKAAAFIKGPTWVGEVASQVTQTVYNSSDPRLQNAAYSVSINNDILDAFTKELYKAYYGSTLNATISLIPDRLLIENLYIKIGRMVNLQLPASITKNNILNNINNITDFKGILSGFKVVYVDGGQKQSHLLIKSDIIRIVRTGSKEEKLLYTQDAIDSKHKLVLYLKRDK